MRKSQNFIRTTVLCLIIAFLSGAGLLITWFYQAGLLRSVYLHWAWVLWIPLLSAVIVLGGSIGLHYGIHKSAIIDRREGVRGAVVAFSILVGILLLISLTGLGITPDIGKDYSGVPVLEWQMVTAFLAGAAILSATALVKTNTGHPSTRIAQFLRSPFLSQPISGGRLDIVICILLWGLSVWLWSNHSMDIFRTSFFAPIRPPNFEPYPYSDSGFYDYISQGVLLGEGYLGGQIVTRPLYIFFLVILHSLFGQEYTAVIFGQTLVLALFPAVLFLLGSRLHSRAAGVTMGLFALFREWNAIAVTPSIGISNSQLILTDLPTALGVSVFTLSLWLWLKQPGKGSTPPLAAGGIFGLMMLMRVQSLVLLAAALAISFISYLPKWRKWMVSMGIFCLGAAIVISPWLARNYLNTGKLSLEQGFENNFLAERYNFPGSPKIPQYTGERVEDYSLRLQKQAVGFILENPGYVAVFLSNHFLSNQINSLLVLPVRSLQFESWRNIFNVHPIFWMKLNQGIDPGLLPLVFLYLLVISIGIGASWQRWRWLGLLPLVINLAYSLSTAVGRISGWRFILPVDWVGYFYFVAGLMELLSLALSALFLYKDPCLNQMIGCQKTAPHSFPKRVSGKTNSIQPIVILLAVLLSLGAALPLSEKVFPRQFSTSSQDELLAVISKHPSIQHSGYNSFPHQAGTMLMRGRIFQPRYYEAGQGEYGANPWPGFAQRNYPRLGFLMINQQVWQIILPLLTTPGRVPNAVDATLVGCQREGYIEAVSVFVDTMPVALISSETICGKK